MKYILNYDFDLCGWQKVPYAIKDKKGNVEFLNKKAFDLLDSCEGSIDFDIPIYNDEERNYIKNLLDRGIVREAKSKNDKRKINYTFYDNRYIREVQFAITGKCNFLCKHCYMSAHNDTAKELSLDKIFYIIDEFKKAGVFNISITGGECLIRKDFYDIIDRIIENKINITTIYTNGWLVNEKLLDELEKRNIKPFFSISFDGVGHHDYMRGVEGAEKACDRAFRLLQSRGYQVDVETCLFDRNKYALRDTIKYLDSVGVSYVKVNPVSRLGEWKNQNESEDINIEDALNIYINYIKDYFDDDLKTIDIQLSGLFLYNHKSNTYTIPCYKECADLNTVCVCGHARLISYVTEEGITLPCPSLSAFPELKSKFPSILENGYAKCITESSEYMDFISKKGSEIIAENLECKNCEYKENCYGGCRASAYDYTKNLMAKDEATCIIFKKDYIKKIKNLMNEIRPDIQFVMS